MQSTHGLHGKSMGGILNLSQRVEGSYRKVSLRCQLFHQTGPIDIQKTKREESGWGRLRRRNIWATRLSPDGKTWITKSISKIMVRSPPPTALPCREQHSIQSRQFGFHGLLGHTSLERVILHWGWKYRDKVRQHHSIAPITITSRMGKTKYFLYVDTQSIMVMLRDSQALSYVIVTQPTELGLIIPDEQMSQRENDLSRVTQSGSGEVSSWIQVYQNLST